MPAAQTELEYGLKAKKQKVLAGHTEQELALWIKQLQMLAVHTELERVLVLRRSQVLEQVGLPPLTLAAQSATLSKEPAHQVTRASVKLKPKPIHFSKG